MVPNLVITVVVQLHLTSAPFYNRMGGAKLNRMVAISFRRFGREKNVTGIHSKPYI